MERYLLGSIAVGESLDGGSLVAAIKSDRKFLAQRREYAVVDDIGSCRDRHGGMLWMLMIFNDEECSFWFVY